MTDPVPHILDGLVTAYREGDLLALLFDYDGTLTPIVDHPAYATLASHTRDVMQQLAALPRVVVGILSGRCLADLKNMVGISDIVYVGTGGLELEYDGISNAYPDDGTNIGGLVDRIEKSLCPIMADYPGAALERKPLALTVHFRHTKPDFIELLQSDVSRSIEPFRSRLRILPAPMALEILPDLGWDKGSAIRFIVRMLDARTSVFYAGDYANDADAFITTNALKGVSLGIGQHAPEAARYRLPDPRALNGLLYALLHKLADEDSGLGSG